MDDSRENRYFDLLLRPIKVCSSYKPKMGKGGKSGLTLQAFQKICRADPFYAWLGLDNPLMYAAHKAAGGMTSVYRQIGIGCEELFRVIIQDQLGLSSESASDGAELDHEDFRDLLKVAFCRTMIGLSNAASNHQSMSFKSEESVSAQGVLFLREGPLENFLREVDFIMAGARENPTGFARILAGDSRKVEKLTSERFDLVITSPPYPNRMSST